MNPVTKYARLVKFAHTVFAMPFALMSFVYALWSIDFGAADADLVRDDDFGFGDALFPLF